MKSIKNVYCGYLLFKIPLALDSGVNMYLLSEVNVSGSIVLSWPPVANVQRSHNPSTAFSTSIALSLPSLFPKL